MLLCAFIDPLVDAAEDLLVPGSALGEVHPAECSRSRTAVTPRGARAPGARAR
jgi:hypothetical protein